MYLYLSLALTVAAGISFVYGLYRFFRAKSPLYVRMIVLGVGCAMLSVIDSFLFFFSANFGQMDSIVDDGSPKFRVSGNGWYNGVLWQELGADGHVMSPTDKFVAGKEYRVSVSLETTSGGYRFKNSESYYSGTIPYVNGNVSEAVSTYGERSRGTLSYTFKSGVKTVGAVKLTGLSKSIPGKSAAANPPAGKTENAGVVIKEAKWSNLVPNPNNEGYYKYADFTGKYVEGTLYFPTYVLTTSEGYAFGNQVEVTLPSGKTQTIYYISNNTITLYDAGVTETSKVTLIGDADTDGEVTIFDATAIQRYLADLPVPNFSEKAADADEDGGVTIFDATAIQRYLAELPSNPNIGKPIV